MSRRVSQLHPRQLPISTGEGSSACFSSGEGGGSDIDKSQPSSWSKEQVYTWVCHALNVGPKQLAFLKHSIEAWAVDGAKLLSLTREDLRGTLRLRDGALVDALVRGIDQLRVLDEILNQLAALRLLMDDAASVRGTRHSGFGSAVQVQMEELVAQEQAARSTLAALRMAQDMDLALQLDLAEQQSARDHQLALRLHRQEGGEEEGIIYVDASPRKRARSDKGDPGASGSGLHRDPNFRVGERLTTLAVPRGTLIEVRVGAMGVPSTVVGVCNKPISNSKNKGAMTYSHLQHRDCDICQDRVWTTDAINAAFHFEPRGANPILFCNECLRGLCQAAAKDATLIPLSFNGEAIDQNLADLILHDQPDVLQILKAKLEEKTAVEKMYCPRPSCSTFINLDRLRQTGPLFTCPGCGDHLCRICHARWHNNLTCRQYQNLPAHQKISEEDQATAEVLKQDGFQRCSACKMMVELEHGCFHMTCRCGHEFCYLCGVKWKGCTCPHLQEEHLLREAGTRVQGMVLRQGRQLTPQAFQEAVAQMAERLRLPQRCAGHKWRVLNGGINGRCSNCGFFLRHFCYTCEDGNCGVCVCQRCRFHRNVPLWRAVL